ncbi:MAG: helix-turn-helix domain-containing protein [Gemmatimonadota bacterium]|jgi:transposase|nr:helix-turn-helix domain-containing protein [Gemmatimonadota bacterium]
MPRQSPYGIVLSPEEQSILEARARQYRAPHAEVVRAKLILLAAQGLENERIAQRLDLTRQMVSKWRKRFHAERLEGLCDSPRSGRPPAFSPSGGGRGQGARL